MVKAAFCNAMDIVLDELAMTYNGWMDSRKLETTVHLWTRSCLPIDVLATDLSLF